MNKLLVPDWHNLSRRCKYEKAEVDLCHLLRRLTTAVDNTAGQMKVHTTDLHNQRTQN